MYRPQIEPQPTRCQYPFINYLGPTSFSQGKIERTLKSLFINKKNVDSNLVNEIEQ